jgi:hypothetical protein
MPITYSPNIQRPDNGGVSVDAYSHNKGGFGSQLTGPFSSGARTGFAATAGSLNAASKDTFPGHSLNLVSWANFNMGQVICQYPI